MTCQSELTGSLVLVQPQVFMDIVGVWITCVVCSAMFSAGNVLHPHRTSSVSTPHAAALSGALGTHPSAMPAAASLSSVLGSSSSAAAAGAAAASATPNLTTHALTSVQSNSRVANAILRPILRVAEPPLPFLPSQPAPTLAAVVTNYSKTA